jgi:hypothetical protein
MPADLVIINGKLITVNKAALFTFSTPFDYSPKKLIKSLMDTDKNLSLCGYRLGNLRISE